MNDNFDFAKNTIDCPRGKAEYFSLEKLKEIGCQLEKLPYSIRVLLENTLRSSGKDAGAKEAVYKLSEWPKSIGEELPFMPYRVLLQDYTGVPLIVDLAAMRSAFTRRKLDPRTVNSKVPVDLIIDHSVQVDSWSVPAALLLNLEREYERNSERYSLLKWAHSSFSDMRVFPPGKGICHQVNLEYLAKVVSLHETDGILTAFSDTLVGTDSHTTMVNGLGVLGWGVGGIEAEAVMLGEPYYMPIPRVIGVKLTGRLQEGATCPCVHHELSGHDALKMAKAAQYGRAGRLHTIRKVGAALSGKHSNCHNSTIFEGPSKQRRRSKGQGHAEPEQLRRILAGQT